MSVVGIEVLNRGALTTVQDLGRFGYAHLGISAAGAADSLSFRIANRILGNDENAPALEMTLVGPTLQFRQACTIAVVGAETSGAVPMFEPVQVAPGFILECGPLRAGARTYLAVRGGINVPMILGSASTLLAAGLGGHEGRALKRGDVLSVRSDPREAPNFDAHALRDLIQPQRIIRITKGPQQHWFADREFANLCASEYVVTEQSNRLGLRLSGTAVRCSVADELLTEGVSLGAIQIPPDGQPIILFVDQQTTGGYPKIANVIAADMHCIGQLRPRDTLHFILISMEEAIHALRHQELRLARAFGE